MKDRYEIGKLIGSGFTGGTYVAVDKRVGRTVAVRRLFPDVPVERCRECQGIFSQVINQGSKLHSKGMIDVIDGGLDDEGFFIVTEYLEGPLLGQRLVDEPLALVDFEQLVDDLLTTIDEIHSHHMCHTALSSRSVQLSKDAVHGVCFKLIDFGLASLIRSLEPEKRARHYGMIDPVLMAPEYHEGKTPTVRMDLYSCGQLFYASLAGGHPLGELGFEEIYDRLKDTPYPPVNSYREDVPQKVADWIARLTAWDPEDRFESAREALEKFPGVPVDREIKLVNTERRKILAQTQLQKVVAPAAVVNLGAAPQLVSSPPVIQVRKDNTVAWVAVVIGVLCLVILMVILVKVL